MVEARARRAASACAAVLIGMTVSCSDQPDYPGDDLRRLPAAAAGAVVVGPLAMESVGQEDRSLLFVFGADGKVIGRDLGAAVSNNRVLAAGDRLVTSFADSVAAISEDASEQFGIDRESIVQSAAIQPEGGASTIWYNTGIVNGEYVNRFASIGADNSVRAGKVAGIVGTSSYCGKSNFAVVRQSVVGGENATKNWLYELGQDNTPVARGQWDYDPEFRPVTSTSPCTADGSEIVALYASEQTVTGGGTTGLTLVKFRTADGTRTETALTMPGYTWETHRSSLAVLKDKLYWVTRDGDVLSVPLDGSNTVTKEWTVHGPQDKVALSVRGQTISAISYRENAEFSQYDLASGRKSLGPIALAWLDDIQGSKTESGGNIYSIADMTGLE
ncbi:hypothetical protein [Nocardia sp. CS682]|uniref:hypothetical protein n=1 Tax=Nocardia sp. CS682 TaxID=1047172 RepID=UPI0010754A55|nr:hypothetical protein [Nocardia sp. CS682]